MDFDVVSMYNSSMSSAPNGSNDTPPGPDAKAAVKRRSRTSDDGLVEADHLMTAAGPGVVPLRRLVVDRDHVELQMEVASGSVADVLAERGRLSEPESRAVGVAIAGGLARLHDAGLVHADVKPANVLLTADRDVWLADLDATRLADDRPLTRLTPDRCRLGATATPGTDVISLAVMIVEMSTGVAPDPNHSWGGADLVDLGCPPRLAAQLAVVLGADAPPTATAIGDLLGRGERLEYPEPARSVRGTDPTPTLDFDAVGAHPEVGPASTERPVALAALLVIIAVAAALVAGAMLAL